MILKKISIASFFSLLALGSPMITSTALTEIIGNSKSNTKLLTQVEEYLTQRNPYKRFNFKEQQRYLNLINSILINEPNNSLAYAYRARIKNQMGDHISAFNDARKSIQIDPRNAQGYFSRSISKYFTKEYSGSKDDINKAIKLDPTNSKFYTSRCAFYNQEGDYEKAILDCNKAIKIDKTDILAYTNRGIIYSFTNKNNAAIDEFNKALEIDKGTFFIFFMRGMVKELIGDKKGACEDTKIAIDNKQTINSSKIVVIEKFYKTCTQLLSDHSD